MKKIFLVLLVSLIPILNAKSADTDSLKALDYARQAIDSFRGGNNEQGNMLLDSAIKYDPGNSDYVYEKALSFFKKQDFDKAIVILDTLVDKNDAKDVFYRLLGSCYAYKQKYEKAVNTWEAGLLRFPNSGSLYHDLGDIYYRAESFSLAVNYWEKGIMADPGYMNNYYSLVKSYELSRYNMWPVIYAEIFLNKSMDLKKNTEIGAGFTSLFDRSLTKIEDTVIVQFDQVSFPMIEFYNEDEDYNFSQCFNFAMYQAARKNFDRITDSLDIRTVYMIRKDFIEQWYKFGFNEKFPNALFEWQKKIFEKGLYEPYNYWLMSESNPAETEEWVKNNKDLFIDFTNWMKKNVLELNKENSIYRGRYDEY